MEADALPELLDPASFEDTFAHQPHDGAAHTMTMPAAGRLAIVAGRLAPPARPLPSLEGKGRTPRPLLLPSRAKVASQATGAGVRVQAAGQTTRMSAAAAEPVDETAATPTVPPRRRTPERTVALATLAVSKAVPARSLPAASTSPRVGNSTAAVVAAGRFSSPRRGNIVPPSLPAVGHP
jgi:hypothetical protein